jgi:CRISPR-associated protein Cas2
MNYSGAASTSRCCGSEIDLVYVIAYDIGDDRRREEISGMLSACGARVQLSVFECVLPDTVTLGVLRDRLRATIDPTEDQIRMYPLAATSERAMEILGSRTLEERRDFWIV